MSDESPQPRGEAGHVIGDRRGAQILSAAELAAHTAGSRTIASRHGYPVLLAHADAQGNALVTRLWRRRNVFSYWLRPPLRQFQRTLERLDALGIPVPAYRSHGRDAHGSAAFIVYAPLTGTPQSERPGRPDVKKLAELLALLHWHGVDCRRLNLHDVVLLADGRLGLNDPWQVRLRRAPLQRRRRERNVVRLCLQLAAVAPGTWSELIMAYSLATRASLEQAADLRERVRVRLEGRRPRRPAPRAPAEVFDALGPVTDKMRVSR